LKKKGIQDVEFCFLAPATAMSSPQKNNNESNNKMLYQKKTRKKSWTMWRYKGGQDLEKEWVRQYCR
jgi:hypothetical protein